MSYTFCLNGFAKLSVTCLGELIFQANLNFNPLISYPHMLTMGGFAMTFPLCMEEKNGYTSSNTCHDERADTGADSAKINLFSVTHRYGSFIASLV